MDKLEKMSSNKSPDHLVGKMSSFNRSMTSYNEFDLNAKIN